MTLFSNDFMYGGYYRPQIFQKEKIIGFIMLGVGLFCLAKITGWIASDALISIEVVSWIAIGSLLILGLFLMGGEHHRY